MVSAVVVVLDEGVDGLLERARQVIVFQQDAILQGLVPSLDLALGLRVARARTIRAKNAKQNPTK